jgi:hypothetical protein
MLFALLRASPPVLSMWPYRGWGKVKTCRFGSGNWFLLSIMYSLPSLAKGAATLCTCRTECSKCDLTSSQCFWLVYHNDWSKWFAISSSPPICCSVSVLWVGCQKVNMDLKNTFAGSHILSTAGDALRGWNGGWLAYDPLVPLFIQGKKKVGRKTLSRGFDHSKLTNLC